MNPIIKFSNNWNNKLDNFCFTSVRKIKSPNFSYYQGSISKTFDVFLEGKLYTQAKLVSVSTYKFSNIPQLLLAIDTGKVNFTENVDIFRKFGLVDRDDMMMVLFFAKV